MDQRFDKNSVWRPKERKNISDFSGIQGSIFSVNAANTSSDDYTLYFGFVSTMTDVYDQGACANTDYVEYGDCVNNGANWIGDQYAPPTPPAGTFDAALTWGSDRYYSQLLLIIVNVSE